MPAVKMTLHQCIFVLSSSWDGRPYGCNRHRPKRGGCFAPFGGRARSPSNKMWSKPRPTSVLSAILIHPAVWPQQTWAENWGWEGKVGSPSNTIYPGPRPTSVPSSILIHPAVWPQQARAKIGGCAHFGAGELCPHLTQCDLDRGPPPCQVSSWSIQPFGHNKMSQTGQITVW